LIYSLKEGIVALWSTSRNELWVKGATSNQCFKLKKVLLNCEGNSLLFLVEPQNNAGFCHMKNDSGEHRKSCFFREVILDENGETKVV
jgi:phosphoribosyl-AMP cyclohydrolase